MNSNKSWDFRVAAKVYKTLRKFPKPLAQKIVQAIEALPENPYAGDIDKVEGERFLWRRRVGEYRIFFEIHQDKRFIDVVRVERKGSKTYS